jgi:hypothetical protein
MNMNPPHFFDGHLHVDLMFQPGKSVDFPALQRLRGAGCARIVTLS